MVCAECRRKQFRPRKRECGIYESIKGVDACAHAKLPETAVAAALWPVPRNRDILKGDWHSSKMQAVSFRVMKRSLCTIVVCLAAFAFLVATEVAEAGPFEDFFRSIRNSLARPAPRQRQAVRGRSYQDRATSANGRCFINEVKHWANYETRSIDLHRKLSARADGGRANAIQL